MIVTTFAHGSWNKYGGLLIAGFGLGPTVPICMSWSAEIFQNVMVMLVMLLVLLWLAV